MSALRIGIIGSGGIATHRAHSFAALPECRIAAIAARNPETGPALAEAHGSDLTTDWRSLVARDDLDALVVATHNALHAEIVAAGLEQGRHIFCEYPTSRRPAEWSRIASLIEGSAVLRLTHNAHVSEEHLALSASVQSSAPPAF